MIYLSIVVPSYNAAKFLDRCIPSLVPGGDDVEIIVVNDGSKDNTLEVAQGYAAKFSNIKIIDKENGGHGSGINAALEIATGLYFKCVDADDWLDHDSYMTLLAKIKENHEKGTDPDLYLTNFVYNRLDEGTTSMQDHSKIFPPNRLLEWEDLARPANDDFFMMHMFVYKLEILHKAKLRLPEHTFYVDNIYVYEPLYYVKTLYYLPIPLYQYFVGHADQSISIKNMAKNFMHDLRVYERVIMKYTMDDMNKLSKRHRKYMIFMLVVNTTLAVCYSYLGRKQDGQKIFKQMTKRFKKENRELYNQVHHHTEFIWYHFIPAGPIRNLGIRIGYKIVVGKTGWC